MMALDGTDTYVVCPPGFGEPAVIDPGPPDKGHLSRLERALAYLGAECRWILVTHHHIDHAEAGAAVGGPVGPFAEQSTRTALRALADEGVIGLDAQGVATARGAAA